MILLGIFWLIGVAALVILGLGYAVTVPLMRRRAPDPADHPAQYGMPCAEVQFPSRDGTLLGGWWIAARGRARGTVIVCSGQNGSMDKDVPQAVPLHAAGFNVFMFDFRAHGRSEGRLVTIGTLEQLDLLGALDYAAENGSERVGVLGFSMGAGVALLAAAQDTRIAALVVDGAYPWLSGILAGWARIRGAPDRLARGLAWLALLIGSLRSHYQLYRANPIDFAHRIKAPVLFIHGEQDPFVPNVEIAGLLVCMSGPADLWSVPDAGHREAFEMYPDEYNRRVVEWFERYLDERG